MKSVVLGKVVEIKHTLAANQTTIVDENGKEKLVYMGKPTILKEESVKAWREICRFKGEPIWNCEYKSIQRANFHSFDAKDTRERLNISENEDVAINKQVFRADLKELHLYSDKVIGEINVDKEDTNITYHKHLKNFNKKMIESNEKMKAYCDLHGLDYETSDCEKVFEIVYPGEKYKIVNGEMRVMKTSTLVSGVTLSPNRTISTANSAAIASDAISKVSNVCNVYV